MISSRYFRRLPMDTSAERLSEGRLRHKLLALWLGSILVTLLLVGVITTSFLDEFGRREAQRDIGLAIGQFKHELSAVSAALDRQTDLVARNQTTIAALNMVHRYQDVTAYKPLVFDGEKRSQALLLAERIRTTDLDFAAIYDGGGTLAAFADADGAGHHTVIDGAETMLRRSDQNWAAGPPPPAVLGADDLRRLSQSGSVTRSRDGRLVIDSVTPVKRPIPDADPITVGYVHTSKIIGDDVLVGLSNRTGLSFAIVMDDNAHSGPLPYLDPARFASIPNITEADDCPCGWLEDDAQTVGATRLTLDDSTGAAIMAGASTKAVSAVQRYYERASVAVLLVVAALVAPVGLVLLNRTILVPLARLMDGVEALRFGRRVHLGHHFHNDEFGTLAANFDAMADDIAEREDELRRTIDQLARSRSELERFTFVAAHDLQEPLRLVASYTQLLKRRYGGKLDSDADEFIGFAVEGAERMKVLIQNVLDYSHVEDETPFEDVDLNVVAQTAIDSLDGAIKESGADITVEPLPVVRGNPAQLTQVFEHLLSNALKFRRGTPKITISAHQERLNWVTNVADNGIGIDAEYLPQLFTLFRRLHTSREYPGSGLGLAIARRIVERHSGQIWAESEPNEGTSIHFTLPAV